MTALETARGAYAAHPDWEGMPDWVGVLAQECDLSSQGQVAKRIGRSPSVVSNVLRAIYPGNMEAVEDIVRGTLMNEEIDCLGLGRINKRNCRNWRNRSRHFANVNSLYVTMYRACNRCPINKKEDRTDES